MCCLILKRRKLHFESLNKENSSQCQRKLILKFIKRNKNHYKRHCHHNGRAFLGNAAWVVPTHRPLSCCRARRTATVQTSCHAESLFKVIIGEWSGRLGYRLEMWIVDRKGRTYAQHVYLLPRKVCLACMSWLWTGPSICERLRN